MELPSKTMFIDDFNEFISKYSYKDVDRGSDSDTLNDFLTVYIKLGRLFKCDFLQERPKLVRVNFIDPN